MSIQQSINHIIIDNSPKRLYYDISALLLQVASNYNIIIYEMTTTVWNVHCGFKVQIFNTEDWFDLNTNDIILLITVVTTAVCGGITYHVVKSAESGHSVFCVKFILITLTQRCLWKIKHDFISRAVNEKHNADTVQLLPVEKKSIAFLTMSGDAVVGSKTIYLYIYRVCNLLST